MRNVVIVGAGIVGAALAAQLAADFSVEVIEKGAEKKPTGSTGYASGFVGLFNVAPVLTELTRAGATRYDEVPAGFCRVGGLEVATTVDGLRDLVRRTATTAPAAR